MTLTTPRTDHTDLTPQPLGIADDIAAMLTPLFGGSLPVRLRAWDGSAAGPEDAPTVAVNTPAALRRLIFHPASLDSPRRT